MVVGKVCSGAVKRVDELEVDEHYYSYHDTEYIEWIAVSIQIFLYRCVATLSYWCVF